MCACVEVGQPERLVVYFQLRLPNCCASIVLNREVAGKSVTPHLLSMDLNSASESSLLGNHLPLFGKLSGSPSRSGLDS
jgi:hypothetical protein